MASPTIFAITGKANGGVKLHLERKLLQQMTYLNTNMS
jgi:hypothetical protein